MDTVTIQSAAPVSPEDASAALAAAAATAVTTEAEAVAKIAAEKEAAAAETKERPAWLPEKFKTEADLAAAYAELEKKVGAPKEEATSEEKPEEAPKEDDKKEVTDAEKPEPAKVIADIGTRFQETGVISEDDYALAEKTFGVDRAFVDQYAAGQKALADAAEARITEAAGGKENMERMFAWASTSLTAAEVEDFNKSFANADVTTASLAMEKLKGKYETANGRDPKLLAGKPSGSDSSVFRSWAEVTEAMSDKRYGKDPAYSNDVQAKLVRSKI